MRRVLCPIQIAFHRPKNLSIAFCIHLRGKDRDGSFCPFPLSLCPVSLKLGSLSAVSEKASSMEQAKEAGGGGEREAWFGLPFLTLRARRESDSVTVWSWGSLTSLGATFTGKEQQQHTHSGQTTLKRKKATGSGSQARKGLAAHSGCLLLIKETFARAHLLATGSQLGPAPAFLPVATGPAPGRAGCSLLFTSGQSWPLRTKTHCAQVHRLSFGSL